MSKRRIYLHVGAPKTGTTYLQDRLALNATSLRRHGYRYPTGPHPDMFLAALNLIDRPWGGMRPQAEGEWEALVRRARRSRGTVVLSHEILAGAKPAAAKTIIPAFATSAIGTAALLAIIATLSSWPKLVTAGDLAVIVVLGVGCGFLVYLMKFWKVLQAGSLPFFNGISMVLAVYFTTSFPHVTDQALLAALWAGVWTVVLGVFGVLLGMFNVWLTFPKKVEA